MSSERIAYEELQPGDRIQPGDEWKNGDGRWQPYVCLTGLIQFVQDGHAARRPHNITQMEAGVANVNEVLAEVRADEKRLFDDLELLRSEYAKLQNERDELKAALRDSHAAHEFTMKQGLAACRERDAANAEIQNLLKTIAENADMFGDHTKALVQERDTARAERDRLQGLIDDLLDEPTAKQVQDMLRTWATELDWSAGCFDSVAREQIDTIQKTLVAVIERIEGLINPEGNTDGE